MFTTRTVLAVAVTSMMLFLPAPRLAADDGAGPKPPDTAKPAAAIKPATANRKPGPAEPGSAIEAELQQLRDALASQQATLEAQHQRITYLESQLHVVPAETPAPASSPSALAAEPASDPAAVTVPAAGGTSQPAQTGGTALNGDQAKSPLSFRIGSADFTPGGWADITGIFRSTDIGSGTGTNFQALPFNNTLPQGALSEFRFTAQTSRITMKVDAPVTDSTHVTAYIESDFNGFQSPNAYLNTNSGTFRLRLFWADVKHDKWELLAGQSWSLLTPNRVGLSAMPADVFTTARLDTNYIVGLTYARQAGVRLMVHPRDWWTMGVALENPQQYVPSSVVFPGTGTFFSGQFDNGSGATNGGGAATNAAIPNLHPDIIVKSAFDWKVGGHALHVEQAGLVRSFKVLNNLVTPFATSRTTGAAGALDANLELFDHFHLVFDSFWGAGGGRYIGSLGPDVIVKADGTLSAVHSGSGIAGFEYQVTPTFLFDGYYGGAYFSRNVSFVPSTASPAPSCDGVSGFTCVGYGFRSSASTNNRAIEEGTFGFTKTFWSDPNYGKLQFISQSSYAVRDPWFVAAGAPKNAHAYIQYINLRYVLP